MNKIVWIMGQSAAGKETFIQYAVANPNSELMQKLGYGNNKIIPISDDYCRRGIIVDYHDRVKIIDIVLDFLKNETNAAIFIKWQYTDNDEHNDVIRKLKAATPNVPNEMIMLSVDGDVLYARLPNKWWWNESTSSTRKQMDEVVSVLRYNIIRWQSLGLKLTAEIDATDGYKIIENSELNFEVNREALISVLRKMFGANITHARYETTKLYGWVCDNVRLITGTAETAGGESLPFKVVLKKQRKVRPPLDENCWTREYYFYASDFYKILDENVGMPKCYHSEFSEDGYVLWLEYIEGLTGNDLTIGDLEYISEKLGAFHGRIYTQPELTKDLGFLTNHRHMEKKIWSWHNSPEYDYLRSEKFEAPEHLKKMLIEIDDNKEEVLKKIEQLPVVLYHGDFCLGNFFLKDGKVILFDWGHFAGLGHLGEDIANLISDNGNYELWGEYYNRFAPAYLRAFSEYVDISGIKDFYIREMIILNYGYDIVQKYMYAQEREEKERQINELQKIYEMGDIKL